MQNSTGKKMSSQEAIKYFTPSIEDIRVGYELEVYYKHFFSDKPTEEGWENHIVRLETLILYAGEVKKGVARVPYLTKEQIEKEGWEYMSKSVDIWFKKEGSFEMYGWTARKVVCHYGLHDKKLTIYADDTGTDHHIFQGQCKDINTFRYICKLLGI